MQTTYQIFTGKQNIKSKEWKVIGNIPTTNMEDKYRVYHVAGTLYNNETNLGLLKPGEESNYTELVGFSFGVVDIILVNTVTNMLSKNELQVSEVKL